MLSHLFNLGGWLLMTASTSPRNLLFLAFDPVARSASQPGKDIVPATRHYRKDVAVLRPRERAR